MTEQSASSLAVRVGHLFDTVHPSSRGSFSYKEVSEAIASSGGPTISATYLWQLRKGLRDNPTKSHLEAIADFFGVPVTYFFDEDTATRVNEQLAIMTALRDAKVRSIALRSAGLSGQSLSAISAMIDQARSLEGLPEAEAEENGE